MASECHAPEGWCGFRAKDQIRQRAHHPLSHQKLLKLGPGGSSGYNSADQTCTCLLGLGERSQSIPAPLSLHSRVYGMSKWKHGASCRAVITKDEGHRGKKNLLHSWHNSRWLYWRRLARLFWLSCCESGDIAAFQWDLRWTCLCIFFIKKTETNKCWKKTKPQHHSSSLQSERVQLCYRDGAASTMCLFSIGMDNKIWTGRTFSSALMLQRRRQWRSRREEIRRGSIKKGPIGCNLADLSLSTPNAVQSDAPRDELLQTSAGFNKVLNPPLCSELIGPVVRLHVLPSCQELSLWMTAPSMKGRQIRGCAESCCVRHCNQSVQGRSLAPRRQRQVLSPRDGWKTK